jgi:very-short-patch-repair endonuclease
MNWPELAATQHGLVTVAQLRSFGITRRGISHRVATGRLAPVRRGVYAAVGLPADVWRPLAAALLTVDAVASHRAAAGLHRFPGIRPGAVEIMVFGTSPPRLAGVVAHRAHVVHPDEVVKVGVLPATSPARTLVDVAGQVQTGLLEKMLDDCAMRRLCSPDDVAECLDRSDVRRGVRRLRPLLAARVQADSHLEQTWLRRLARAGLRPPEVGYHLVVGDRVLVLDFAWPVDRVGLEVDGWRPHATRRAFDGDRLRDLVAIHAGWTVLRITSRTPPRQLFATLRSLISQ